MTSLNLLCSVLLTQSMRGTMIGKNCNMSFVYGILAISSLLIALAYYLFGKKKNIWLVLLFFSVLLVNVGYFSLSISGTLEVALIANRISYLGSVFLPMLMLLVILDVCQMKYSKKFVAVLFAVSLVVFLIAASPGYLDWYYKEVTLVTVNGMSKLNKVYGPLHSIYFVYLLLYFDVMIGVILYSAMKKTIASFREAVLLLVVVLLNIVIWFVEQLIHWDFEFLSVSYIISEIMLMLIYSVFVDYKEMKQYLNALKDEQSKRKSVIEVTENDVTDDLETQDTEMQTDTDFGLNEQGDLKEPQENMASKKTLSEYDVEELCFLLPEVRELTNRELEVFRAILQNKKRKDIADEFCVSENTIKKHTSHIFAKLNVTNRVELFAILTDRIQG